MFNSISWQGYWLALAFLLAGYYLVIYLLYFRNDFTIILPKRKAGPSSATSDSMPPKGASTSPQVHFADHEFSLPAEGTEERLVYALVDELKAYFEEAKKQKRVKEELLYAIQRILSKSPTVKDSIYNESISNVIVSEAALHCSLHLSREDIRKVWLG